MFGRAKEGDFMDLKVTFHGELSDYKQKMAKKFKGQNRTSLKAHNRIIHHRISFLGP